MTVRGDVVDILTVTDLGTVLNAADRSGWKRQDGTPLTVAEQELVAGANREELIAGREFAVIAMNHAKEEVADLDRVKELCWPYFSRLPKGASFAEVKPLMTDAERLELESILDRLAPDGVMLP
jgi:hypothetical protein